MDKHYRSVSDKKFIKEKGRFTNTAVPRFDGAGCWQQHLQIVQVIVKSSGWSAALQPFAHLDGEALHVALLMPKGEREKWKDLSNGLSDYYNSPGRLAFRQRFESVIRRLGMVPATFATKLGILAVRGFGDMGKRAPDTMIRDKFIAAQRNCGLRRHLDGVPPDTSIWEIVDSCRVWESHSDRTWILGGSPVILRNSNVSGRVCRRYWWAWEWTHECQFPGLELFQGTVRRMVSWPPYRPYLCW